jgi:hypothetical protein
MENRQRFFILAATILTLGACAPEVVTEAPANEPPETEQTAEEIKSEEKEQVDFEEQIEEMISIEGMEEPITLNLYNPPEAMFLTYVPDDLLVEEASGGEGESHKFHANFGGNRLEDIYLQIYIF